MPQLHDHPAGVRVLIAAKSLAVAKSRLVVGLGDALRGPLVLAMLADTVTVALGCDGVSSVTVVTPDPVIADRVRALGASVVAEREGPAAGLDAALALAFESLGGAGWTAALQGDLPAVRPGELAEALAEARRSGGRAFVADEPGTGTTLLVSPDALASAFGPDSAAVHARGGARALPGRWPGLRRDVDTAADLAAALRLGVGPATAAVLAATGTAATVERADQGGAGRPGGLALRTDDGRVVAAPGDAAVAGGWRRLRVGQRVRVHAGADGTVRLLTVPGLLPPG